MLRPPILAVSGLTVSRGGKIILENITWRVEPDENWVILGANGSGKTSLLSALTGYLTPSKGIIDVLGRRFGRTDWRELRKNIGLVSSSIRQMLPEDELALRTVASGRSAAIDLQGILDPESEKAARRLLRALASSQLADRPWRILSQGERQRVLIARALMARPKLLILDEPCAGLDPAAREDFLLRMEKLARQKNGPALVLVTHHIEEITPAFGKVLLLRDGQILSLGDREKMLRSCVLSQVFRRPARVTCRAGRFSMVIQRT